MRKARTREFIKYDFRLCLKTNLITSSIFIVSLIVIYFINRLMFIIEDRNFQKSTLDNGSSLILVMILGFFLLNAIMIIYSIVVPIFIDIYEKFYENFKSLIGVSICNIFLTWFIYFLFRGAVFALVYIVLSIGGMLISLTIRYELIKGKQLDKALS
jgi:hypothetical protein